MSELTMFAYPWDVHVEGVEDVVARVSELGVTRLAVAVSYHSGEIVTPRMQGPVVTQVEANCAHIPLPEDAFSDLRVPQGELARNVPDLVPRLAASAEQANVGLTAWAIALHNSDLAQQHPDVAIEDCFGHRSVHGLCPANERSRTFVRELAVAIARTGHFDSVMLESASFLLAGHGHPHELRAVRMDVRSRFLMSLCFCPDCCRKATERQLDVAALRDRCAALLRTSWNAPLTAQRGDDEGLELAALLATDAELGAYVRMRLDVVSELVEDVAAALHALDVRMLVSTAVWGRPAPFNWAEGIDLGRTARAVDEIVVTTYVSDRAEVARELDHVTEQVPVAQVMQLNTLWPAHNADAAELLGKVQLGLDAGVRSFGLYNLSTAPAPTLAWTRAVADLVAAA